MSSHAAAGPIRNALTPLAHSPRARICNALSKTLGALHDARKEVRRRLLAVIFDGEPLRLRATGADLNWDDDDQTSEVRAAVTVDERGDDGVNTFQLSLALDGYFRPRELATCLQTCRGGSACGLGLATRPLHVHTSFRKCGAALPAARRVRARVCA